MEGGQRLTDQQQRQEWINNLAAFRPTSIDFCLADFPSLCDLDCDLEAAYRRVSLGKATGPDGVQAVLYHAALLRFPKDVLCAPQDLRAWPGMMSLAQVWSFAPSVEG